MQQEQAARKGGLFCVFFPTRFYKNQLALSQPYLFELQ